MELLSVLNSKSPTNRSAGVQAGNKAFNLLTQISERHSKDRELSGVVCSRSGCANHLVYVATNPNKRAYWKSGSRYEHVGLPGYMQTDAKKDREKRQLPLQD
jgi:hypothetical protein